MAGNSIQNLLRWLRSKLFRGKFRETNVFVSRGKLIENEAEQEPFIREARENSRFIKLEQYLLSEGFSVDGRPIVQAGRRYDLRDWREKVQEPFLSHNLLQHLKQFEWQPSVNKVLINYSTSDQFQSATAYYVTMSNASGDTMIYVIAHIYQAKKRVYSVSVDADQNLTKNF
ncbi:MAG: hypothetical protein AAFY78_07645 [Cyanobacteria bacterium J06648_16]